MFKIAVASGKGGTGKTFIATNIFNVLLRNRYRAMLVDCDAEAPNAFIFFRYAYLHGSYEVNQMVPVINSGKCTFCAECHNYCNYNAVFILPSSGIISIIEELCHGCGACSVACKYDAITEKPVSLGRVNIFHENGMPLFAEARMNTGVMSPVPVIKAAIKQIDSSADIVILDSPPGTSCPFIHTVAAADYVILVTEPTPFGLSDLRQSIETLKKTGKTCGVVINRAGIGNGEVIKFLEYNNIPLLCEIPFKKEIAESYSRGELVSDNDASLEQQLLSIIKTITK